MVSQKAKAPRAIGEVVEDILRTFDPEGYLALFRLIRAWPETAGETIARRTEIVSLKFHTAVIKCSTAMWLQELSLMRRQILSKLRERLGDDSVREIRFIKGTLRRHSPTSAPPPRRLTRLAIQVPEMKDSELKRAFESLIEAWGRAQR